MNLLSAETSFCRALVLCTMLGLLTCVGGCGMVVNLIHAGWGHRVPAEFDGLSEKQVAVICVSNSSSFGPRPISQDIAEQVANLLRQHLRDIHVIDQEKIGQWIDRNDWNHVDYREIGRGVGAEMVVAIDILTFRIHEGQTMYKGRCEFGVSVYDLTQGGAVVFKHEPPEIQFPVNSAQPTTEISERQFRRNFVSVIANRIARHFYAYDFKEDFARDPTLIGS